MLGYQLLSVGRYCFICRLCQCYDRIPHLHTLLDLMRYKNDDIKQNLSSYIKVHQPHHFQSHSGTYVI